MGTLLAAVPLAIGALLLRAGWDDIADGDELVPGILVLALLLAGSVGAMSLTLRRRAGDRLYRVAAGLTKGAVVVFVVWFVVGGLFAPELVATGSGSGRAPSTPTSARVTAVLMLLGLSGVAAEAVAAHRRRRRQERGRRAPLGSGRSSRGRRG